MAFTWCGAAFSRRAIIFDGGGQTGSFPFCGISNHYEPNESCQTNIRIRPFCPRVPHLDGVTLKAISTKDAAEALKLKRSATLSDKLTDELLGSDLLVIAAPTWNFSIPSSLKAWI